MRTAAAADRPVGDAAAARRGGAVPRGGAVDQSTRSHRSAIHVRLHRVRRTHRRRVHDRPAARRLSTGDDRRRRREKKRLVSHRSAGRGHGEVGAIGRSRAAPRRSAGRPSIWSSIHPRLLELIRAHRSTLIFVNSRRLAERLAGALNELAGETLVRSHHGSLARAAAQRGRRPAQGRRLRALVATSSLELGIDMGAIDLVVQIEAPPSVASGLQRIGRGGSPDRRRQRRHHLSRSSAAIWSPAPR